MQRFALIRGRNELRSHYVKLLENFIHESNEIADDYDDDDDAVDE